MNSRGIKLVTDSASDLPDNLLTEHDIDMVPLSIHFGKQEYRDRVDISIGEFYEKMSSSEEFPATSQVNPNQFLEVFEKHLSAGRDVVFVGLSLKLSGTVQSAQIAKDMLKSDRIHVYDSFSFSLGEGLCVLAAADAIAQGQDVGAVCQAIERHRRDNFCCFVLDNLEHLVRGGRLSKAQAVIGSLLSIKPLLSATDEGAVLVKEKVRSQAKALDTIIKRAKEYTDDYSQRRIAVAHTHAPALAEEFAARVEKELKPKDMVISSVGATIGTHAGSGGVGLFA